MKKLLTLFMVMAFAATSFGAMLGQGTQELFLGGSLDSETPVGTDWFVTVGYGYYIMDYVEVGGIVSVSDNDVNTTYDLAVFGEYVFETETQWIPYAGASFGWGGTDPEVGEKSDAGVLTPYAGVKYYIAENVAPFVQFQYQLATDDLYPNDEGELKSTNYGFTLGIRVAFE